MKPIRYLRVALESIVAHKLRAILTMLGIIIGVAAVILLVSLGRGLEKYINDEFNSFGTNLIFIASVPPGENASMDQHVDRGLGTRNALLSPTRLRRPTRCPPGSIAPCLGLAPGHGSCNTPPSESSGSDIRSSGPTTAGTRPGKPVCRSCHRPPPAPAPRARLRRTACDASPDRHWSGS